MSEVRAVVQQWIMSIIRIEAVEAVERAGQVEEAEAVAEEILSVVAAANQIMVMRSVQKDFVKHAEDEVMTPGVGTAPTSD